jgi:hypothetical protein
MSNTLNLGTDGNWGVKKDSLLAYNSENNNFKPLPFDFTRASSATVVNKAGLIETVGSGEPRIDFLGNTKGALKLEPQRTNLITYSEAFDNSYWSKSGVSVVGGFASPSADSPLGAFKLVATTNDPYIYKTGLNVTANTQTASIYVKGVGSSIGKEGRFLFWYIGTAGGTTLSVPFTLTSDWQRVQGSSTPTSGGTIALRIDLPDVSVVGEEVLIYGAQLEEGYATSYIPTSGSALTRLADVCNNGANEQVINSTEGVLYYEGSALADDAVDKRIFLSDGTMNNYVAIGYSRFAGNIIAEMVTGGVLQTLDWGATGVNKTNNNKYALSWGSGTMKFYVNGTQKNTESVTSPTGLNVLEFNTAVDTLVMYSNTRDLRVYNTALTDSELQQLTTI